MNYATVQITGNQAVATDIKPITAGTAGGRVELRFDEAWADFQKTLVWQGSGLVIDDLGCTGLIPAQVLTQPDSPLRLGVYGTKGEEVLPTVWADLGTILPGADPSGDQSADPSLPVWAQIPQLLETELQKAKDSGQFDGPQGERGPQGAPGQVNLDDSSVTAEAAWSGKNTVDKLCPSFTESGAVIACEPVAGYPLSVQADDAAKVYRCGKNLLKPLPGTYTYNGVTIDVYEDGTFVVNGTATATAAIDVAERVRIKEGATYTLSGCTGGSYKTYQLCANSNALELYNSSMPYTGVATGTGLTQVRFYAYAGYSFSNMVIKPQLEVGATATARELYRGTEEFAPGETIPALDGVNTIWADSGDVTVTGKADPKALFEKLTNAILSLGGNV